MMTFATGLALAALWAMPVALSGQARGFGGGGTSTSRVASPAVVASWMSHENYVDGKATFPFVGVGTNLFLGKRE